MTDGEKLQLLIQVAKFYGSPMTYHALWIVPDRPAGALADDYSVHGDEDYDEGDVRPGFAARKALELIGVELNEPNYDFLAEKNLYHSYYDSGFKEAMKKRGVKYSQDEEENEDE